MNAEVRYQVAFLFEALATVAALVLLRASVLILLVFHGGMKSCRSALSRLRIVSRRSAMLGICVDPSY